MIFPEIEHWFIYTWYLIEVDFRHDAMIILVLSFDKPSFKNLSLTHDRLSTLSLLLLSTNLLSRSDEQGSLCWLVLLMGAPLSFSLALSKTVRSANRGITSIPSALSVIFWTHCDIHLRCEKWESIKL